MPIIKSLKTEAGYPHRIHRSKRGRKPAPKYHGRKVTRRIKEHLLKKAAKLDPDA